MYHLAQNLSVPVSYFFDGEVRRNEKAGRLGGGDVRQLILGASSQNDDRILRSPETLGLVRNFHKITNSKEAAENSRTDPGHGRRPADRRVNLPRAIKPTVSRRRQSIQRQSSS